MDIVLLRAIQSSLRPSDLDIQPDIGQVSLSVAQRSGSWGSMQDNVNELALHTTGTSISKNFRTLNHKIIEDPHSADQLHKNKLIGEKQRFQLWAHSLGLHQTGHASLDYRLKDAVVVRNYTAEVLDDLDNNLKNCTYLILLLGQVKLIKTVLEIVLGVRKPFELEDTTEGDNESFNSVEDKETYVDEVPSTLSAKSEESSRCETSSTDSDDSFHEIEFRLESIVERIDILFRLAVKIRSPSNRPMRTKADLYKRIPAASRAAYIRDREQTGINLVAYVQQQLLFEMFRPDASTNAMLENDKLHTDVTNDFNVNVKQAIESQDWREYISSSKRIGEKYYRNMKTKRKTWNMPDEYEAALAVVSTNWTTVVSTYCNTDHWIIRRAGMANARRQQQFVYWKEHASLIGKDLPEKPAAVAEKHIPEPMSVLEPNRLSSGVVLQNPEAVPGTTKSLATSATKLHPDAIRPEDLKSTISYQSRVSTVLSPRGEKIEWPPPPVELGEDKFFICPYCKTLCPHTYLSKDAWRLYGRRDEWIAHENLHRRIWRCAVDESEFETQPDYVKHLKDIHADDKLELLAPELVAAAVDASTQTHRDCPFCPTAFTEVRQMQKHIAWHLEKLALFALPDIDEQGTDDPDRSERTSDSKQGIRPKQGRQGSITQDFSSNDLLNILEDYGRGEQYRGQGFPANPTLGEIRDGPYPLDESMLERDIDMWFNDMSGDELQVPETVSHVRALFDTWPREEGQLKFRKGDIIQVLESNPAETWWKGVSRGHVGHFLVSSVAVEEGRTIPSWYRMLHGSDVRGYEDYHAAKDDLDQQVSRDDLVVPPAPSTQTTFQDLPFPRDDPKITAAYQTQPDTWTFEIGSQKKS